MIHADIKEKLMYLRDKEIDEDYRDTLDYTMDIVDKYLAICLILTDHPWNELDKTLAIQEIAEVIATIPARYFKDYLS